MKAKFFKIKRPFKIKRRSLKKSYQIINFSSKLFEVEEQQKKKTFLFIGKKKNIRENALKAVRAKLVFFFKKQYKFIMRNVAFLPVTQKAAGIRMGKGKGKISNKVLPLPLGQAFFEVWGSNEGIKQGMKRASKKLGVTNRIKSSVLNTNCYDYQKKGLIEDLWFIT